MKISDPGPALLPDALGPVKWGWQRTAHTTPWSQRTQTHPTPEKVRATPAPSHLAHWQGPHTTPPPAFPHPPARQASSLERGLINLAMREATRGTGLAQNKVREALQALDPQRELRAAYRLFIEQRPSRRTTPAPAEQLAAYSLALELARTPAGQDALIQTCAWFRDFSPEDQSRFAVLAQALALEGSPAFDRNELAHAIGHGARLPQRALIAIGAQWAGDAPEAQQHAWTINALRNGLTDDGPGSDFARIDLRLRKIGRWIRRAEQKGLWRRLLPWWGKSPFRAMRLGRMGVDRHDLKDYQAQHLEHAKHMNKTWHAQAVSKLAALPADTSWQAAHWRTWVEARGLIMACNLYRAHLASANEGALPAFRLDGAQIDAIKKRLAADMPADQQNMLDRHPVWRRLAQFEKHCILPGSPLHDHATGLKQLRARNVLSTLHDIMDNMGGASRVKWHSGGSLGIGTKGFTAALSALAGSMLFRARLDARLTRQRAAVCELAMPPYNMELTLGTQTLDAAQLAGGLSAGPHIGVASLTAGGDITALAREDARIEGICLRMPRVRGQEDTLRENFKRMTADIFSLAQASPAPGEILKTLLGRYPDLTVNRIGALREHRRRHAVSAELTAGLDVKALRLLASGSAGAELTSRFTRDYDDAGGAMQVHRRFRAKWLRAQAGAGLSVRGIVNHGDAQIGAGTLDLVGIQGEFASAGRMLRHDVVTHEGRHSPVSFFEVEHQQLDDFVSTILSRLDEWVASKSRRWGRTAASTRAEILRFLDQVRHQARPQHTFAQRYELRDDCAKQADLLSSLASSWARRGDAFGLTQAHALRAELRELLDDRASYEPVSFRIYDRSDVTHRLGVGLGVQAHAYDYADGIYAHGRLM